MSSDTFHIRVLERHGGQVRLRAALTGAQDLGGAPYPGGRAFFLMLAYLEAPGATLDEELRGQAATHGGSPFDLLQDAAWLQANIDRYVTRVTLTRTRMLSYDLSTADQQRFGQWLWNKAYGDDSACADPDALYLDLAPFFECTVEFARPEYAEPLTAGRAFRTVAYAAWAEPPWSTPKLANAPDCVMEELVTGPDGEPIPAPPPVPTVRSSRARKTAK